MLAITPESSRGALWCVLAKCRGMFIGVSAVRVSQHRGDRKSIRIFIWVPLVRLSATTSSSTNKSSDNRVNTPDFCIFLPQPSGGHVSVSSPSWSPSSPRPNEGGRFKDPAKGNRPSSENPASDRPRKASRPSDSKASG